MGFIRSRGFKLLLVLVGLLVVGGAGAAAVFYWTFLVDLPDLRTVEDYRPPLGSHVVDRHGRLIGEYFTERRMLTPFEAIPDYVINAFVAGEDSSFFEHGGLDYQSILRAAWVNLRAGGAIKQGASTITQQMVKGLLLSPERRYRRKIREMILARKIEQHFSKNEILYLYLNQIYFGHGAYGIGEAAKSYFGKEVGELTVSEGAQLAGLPKAPSRYSPFANPEDAEVRRRYVLGRMHSERFIDGDTYQTALAELPLLVEESAGATHDAEYFVEEVRRYLFDALGSDVVLRGGLRVETTVDIDLQRTAIAALRKGLVDLDHRQGYRGPVRHVAGDDVEAEIRIVAESNGFIDSEELVDTEALIAPPAGETGDAIEDTALSLLSAQIVLEAGEAYLGVVTSIDRDTQSARVAFAPEVEGIMRLPDIIWARKPDPNARPRPVKSISRVVKAGDVALFERVAKSIDLEEKEAKLYAGPDGEEPMYVSLYQEPIVQGALLSIDVTRDEVIALVGGYDFGKSQFNRVTQARRQPGSAFKPIIYAAAMERGYTPASIVYDRPVVYTDKSSGFIWRPRNYGRNFYGPITLREALARSVNNATVHLFRDIGVDFVIDFARRLGIESPLSRDLSLALGSSSLTLLELTRAYAVFPAAGRRVVPTFIRRVTDRDGNVVLENIALGDVPERLEDVDALSEEDVLEIAETAIPMPLETEEVSEVDLLEVDLAAEEQDEMLPAGYVIPSERAYLVSDLLHAVVVDPKGTGWRLRALHRPLAGKTGTTNDQADAWFMGFSPEIMTGVWVGHDESRYLGWGETGSRAAAPIWVDFMRVALANRPVRDFTPPEPIVFARIDRKTGLLADSDSTDTVFQPFLTGTEPTRTASAEKVDTELRRELRLDSF